MRVKKVTNFEPWPRRREAVADLNAPALPKNINDKYLNGVPGRISDYVGSSISDRIDHICEWIHCGALVEHAFAAHAQLRIQMIKSSFLLLIAVQVAYIGF